MMSRSSKLERRILAKVLLPSHGLEILDFVKVRVARNQRQVMFERNRRDPNIIFGNRMSLDAQSVLDFTIAACCFCITCQDNIVGCKFVNSIEIFLCTR